MKSTINCQVHWENGDITEVIATIESNELLKNCEIVNYQNYLEYTIIKTIKEIGEKLHYKVERKLPSIPKNYSEMVKSFHITISLGNPKRHKLLKECIDKKLSEIYTKKDEVLR